MPGRTRSILLRAAALAAAIGLLACAPAGAAPPAGSGQAAQDAAPANDEALTKAVESALNTDPNHYFRHVHVRVDQGVATLSGFVDSGAAINRARTIASKVPGITRVATNQLQVDTQFRR